jgi:hypothetical protein
MEEERLISGLDPLPGGAAEAGDLIPASRGGVTGLLSVARVLTAAQNIGLTILGAASKSSLVDADLIGVSDSADSNALKKTTLAQLISSVFTTARTIANAQFAAATFKLFNAAGTPRALTFNVSALTADRVLNLPDGNVTLPSGTVITSADVLPTIAATTPGAVGTYVQARQSVTSTARALGALVAGSNLVPTNADGSGTGAALTGMWSLAGTIPSATGAAANTGNWLRVS